MLLLSSWAYSFPLAAASVASFVMAQHTQLMAFRLIGVGQRGLLVVVVAVLLKGTAAAASKGAICVPD